MCGIAGVIGSIDRETARKISEHMARLLVHRGPDEGGCWAQDGVGIASRRLSIVDIKTGQQPMEGTSGCQLVYNGEIYNYLELRDRLEEIGRNFRTESDTEVVLQAYEEWGLDFLPMFNGMFALGLYDPKLNVLHLARDYVGVKPLYYATINNLFYFASELKAILAVLPNRPALNFQSINHYLTLRYIPAPNTIWEGIYKLEPGQYISVAREDGSYRQPKTFRSFHIKSTPIDAATDYFGKFDEMFLCSVNRQLSCAEVPVGILASGGLDSSSIAAAAKELGYSNVGLFNVSYSDTTECNEYEYARTVSDHLGYELHSVKIGAHDFRDMLIEQPWICDEPLADLTSIPLYYVSRLARPYVRVVLSGEGSDEFLAGYEIDGIAYKLHYLRLALFAVSKLGRVLPCLKRFEEKSLFRTLGINMTNVFSESEKASLWKYPVSAESTRVLVQHWYDLTRSSHPIDQYQDVLSRSWLAEDLLAKADRISMACSLELRVPFLDSDLVDWYCSLPLELRIGNFKEGITTKAVLRNFARSRLPEEIVAREKKGFPIPTATWLRGALSSWVSEEILPAKSKISEFFDDKKIRSLIAQTKKGNKRAIDQVWNLVVLELWMRKWL